MKEKKNKSRLARRKTICLLLNKHWALGQAAVVRARNASHILTQEEMAPYVNLVIQIERVHLVRAVWCRFVHSCCA